MADTPPLSATRESGLIEAGGALTREAGWPAALWGLDCTASEREEEAEDWAISIAGAASNAAERQRELRFIEKSPDKPVRVSRRYHG
jgi:hypothetical protein